MITKKSIVNHNYNIDILRLLLMTMIVLWHFYVHSYDINSKNIISETPILVSLILPLLCCHVNCFMTISGFFGVKFNLKKILDFYLQLLFYSLGYAIISITNNDTLYLNEFIANILMPYRLWWYAEIYIYIMLIGPLITMGMKCLNKKSQQAIVILALIFIVIIPWLLGIANFRMTMLVIYTCACYISINESKILKKHSGKIFLLCIIVLIIMRIISINYNILTLYNRTCSYSNPIVILSGISLFSFFLNLKLNIHIPFLSHIIPGLFAVYLITDFESIRFLNHFIIDTIGPNPLLLLFPAIIICIVIGFIDTLRWRLFTKLTKKIKQ